MHMNNETIGEQIDGPKSRRQVSFIYTPQKVEIWTFGALLAKTSICTPEKVHF